MHNTWPSSHRRPLHRHQAHGVVACSQWYGVNRRLLHGARTTTDVESGDGGRVGAVARAERPHVVADYPEI